MLKKLKILIIIALIFSTGLLYGCGGLSNAAVIVAGSTSVQPYAEILAEEYAIAYPGNNVDIQGGGSSAGIQAAASGTADIGMSSRALSDKEQGFWVIEIAKDGLAMIINPKNPIKSLTLEQIRGIYMLNITNWSELGGADARIHVITREEGSGTRGKFEDLVMDKNKITPRAIVQDSNGAVRQLVSNDVNSIGFISLGLVDSTVKALWLDGTEPSWENVINGSYTLYRPFLFVTGAEPEGQTKHFIDFVLSPEGQQLLANEGLIPYAAVNINAEVEN